MLVCCWYVVGGFNDLYIDVPPFDTSKRGAGASVTPNIPSLSGKINRTKCEISLHMTHNSPLLRDPVDFSAVHPAGTGWTVLIFFT